MEPAGRVQNTPYGVGTSRRRPYQGNTNEVRHRCLDAFKQFRFESKTIKVLTWTTIAPRMWAGSSAWYTDTRQGSGQRTSGLQTILGRKTGRSRVQIPPGPPNLTLSIHLDRTQGEPIRIEETMTTFIFHCSEKIRDRPKGRAFGQILYILDFLLFFFLATSFAGQ